jgi:rubrerythrin
MDQQWSKFHAYAALIWAILIGVVIIRIHLVENRGRARATRLIARSVSAPVCRSCGYDLRASKDRCPECGRAIEAQDGAPV